MNLKKALCLFLLILNLIILSSFEYTYVDTMVEETKKAQTRRLEDDYKNFLSEGKVSFTSEELGYLNSLRNKTIKIKFSDNKFEYRDIGTQNFITNAFMVSFGLDIKVVEDENLADLVFTVGNDKKNYNYNTKPFHNLSTMVFYDYTKVNIKQLLDDDTKIGVSPYLYKYLKDVYKDRVIEVESNLAEASLYYGEIDFYFSLPYEKKGYINSSKIIADIQYMREIEQIPLYLSTNKSDYIAFLDIVNKILEENGRTFLEEIVEDEMKLIKERYFYDNLTYNQIQFLESGYVVKMVMEETPNLAFFDEYGNQAGYVVDYVNQIKEKTDMKIEFTIIEEENNENAFLLTLGEEYDVIPYIKIEESALGDIGKVSITESYYEGEISVLKRIDVEKISSINSLIYKNVGMVYSPAINSFLEEHLSGELKNITYYDTYKDLVIAVSRKNIDYLIVEPGFIEYVFDNSQQLINSAINKDFYSNFYMIVSSVEGGGIYTDTISEILSKAFVIIDDYDIKSKWFLNDAMYKIKTDKTLELKDVSIISSVCITLLIYFLIRFTIVAYKFNDNSKNTIYINKTTDRYNNLALEKYISEVDGFTLITLDIQQFKYLNDIYGNSIADNVFINLSNICDYLKDEYSFNIFTPSGGVVTICIKETDKKKINKFIGNIRLKIKLINNHNELGYDIKIKMIVIDPEYTKDKDNIKQYSKQLFDKIKNTNDNFARYNDKKKEKFDTNKKIEKLLIENMNEKVLPFFQPFICAKTNKVIGCETLARVKDGDKMYFPDQFLPVAISSGVIAEMDEVLFKRTVQNRNKLLADGIIDEKFYFSVNVSAPLLRRLDVKKLMDLRDELNVKDFSFIQIEILEEQITEKEIKNILNIIELFEIRIAIDDFSAGHSSIFRINDFPCDVLKIDKGLLPVDFKRIDEEKYKTILSMIRDSNEMKITCEGVETEEHVNFLKSQDVDIFQGYYYSRPVNINILTEYIMKANLS